MEIISKPKSNSIFFLSFVFLVTQITGLLLSLVVCYILNDFTWGFIRLALTNSFILGLSLIGSCYMTQKLVLKIRNIYIGAISFSLVSGTSIISLIILFFLEPAVFVYYERGLLSFVLINYLFIISLHTISSGLIIYREILLDKEKSINSERFLKNQMEMRLLSSRINPHFLFNTLNMIITLLKEPQKAEIAILNLSDLLRENIYISDKSTVQTHEEVDNVRKYLEIQKLRFEEKLEYKIDCSADFPIPPLLIQPLVENSIKHNMKNVSQLIIEINIFSLDNRNFITVSDSVKALDEQMLNKGQGLTITKKRVENYSGIFKFKNGGIEISFGI